jgi:acyl dehydratase
MVAAGSARAATGKEYRPLEESSFATPRDQGYFEDDVAGSVHDLGPIVVSEHEIVEFARRYDPQNFHTELACQAIYDGLIASGWHTAALMIRLRFLAREHPA